MAKLTDEKLIRELMDKYGWSREATINGYDIFEDEDCTLTVCRIDDLYYSDKFDYGINCDEDACEQAAKDGVKFVNDIKGLEKNRYIDTPENRELCKQYVVEDC